MNTAQESPNGHRVFQPPVSVESPAGLNSADLPANQDNNQQFPASAYHVPPDIYVPKAHAYRNDDSLDSPHLPGPLPDRCQFMFSDGRQCTMARSDIHPSLCVYHSEREEQLFGSPTATCLIRGRSYDLPELFSAARDLSTAASVNRALAQVFRLLAQRSISRQEAATFGHLAQLLLRSISLMRTEPAADAVEARSSFAQPKTMPTPNPAPSFRATNWSEESLLDPRGAEESRPHNTRASFDATSAATQAPSEPATARNPFGINTSATSVCNSREISTSENAGFHPVQNQHLQQSHKRTPPNSDEQPGFPGAPSFASPAQASPGD
jgi:hypothetical protein